MMEKISADGTTRSYGLNDPSNYKMEEWPETKRAIYLAARNLFWANGFAETSVQQIVAAASVTKGAFYHYFGAKDDIMRVMYERSIDHIMHVLDDGADTDGAVGLRIETTIAEMIRVAVENRMEVAMFWEEYRHLPQQVANANQMRREALVARLSGLLREGIASGELSGTMKPGIVTMAIIALCRHAPTWYNPAGAMNAAELGRHHARLLMDGLVPRH